MAKKHKSEHIFVCGKELKYCTKCTEYISIEKFGKSNSWDGLYCFCKKCVSIINHKRTLNRPLEDKKLMMEKAASKRLLHLDIALKKEQEFRDKNKERIRENDRLSRLKSPEVYRAIWKRHYLRKKDDIIFKLNRNLRTALWECLKGKKEGRHTEEILGCSIDAVKNRLEETWVEGMSWENYGNGPGKWSIDHKKPTIAFVFNSYEDIEFKECWKLENLRALWSIENSRKSDNLRE